MEDNYISAYEYENNVNPSLKEIPFYEKNIHECEYGINYIDFSELFCVANKSTTPNLLACFLKVKEKDESIHINNIQYKCSH